MLPQKTAGFHADTCLRNPSTVRLISREDTSVWAAADSGSVQTSTLIAHEHKLTRCDSRDAETAEDEQHESLHRSNAPAVPLTPTGGLLCLVEPLGIHVSSCVSSGREITEERRSVGGSSAPRTALLSNTSAHITAEPPATSEQPPATAHDHRPQRESGACFVFPAVPQKPSPICCLLVWCWRWCSASAPLSCCCCCRVKRAAFVYERLDCSCLPHWLTPGGFIVREQGGKTCKTTRAR